MRDRGSMLVLVVMVGVAVTAAVTLALLPVLGGLVDRQHAQSAADAAALAGVTGGRAGLGVDRRRQSGSVDRLVAIGPRGHGHGRGRRRSGDRTRHRCPMTRCLHSIA